MTEQEDKIKRLEEFKQALGNYELSYSNPEQRSDLRKYINQNIRWVRQEVIEAGCFQTLTISPPPAIGGMIIRNFDPFDMVFERPYGMSVTSILIDLIDRTIGSILNPSTKTESSPIINAEIIKNYAFIAMPMDKNNHELEDVLDAIKDGALRCGIQAERVDEAQSNDRITDRILESIQKSEYVIVDLTNSRPNVFYEAGYAHGIGKIPIYIAKEGSVLEFDLKDYPVIFYRNMKQLKDSLEMRLRSLASTEEKA